jgi:hypothetical protein
MRRITASAVGERQMLPRQTKQTETFFILFASRKAKDWANGESTIIQRARFVRLARLDAGAA